MGSKTISAKSVAPNSVAPNSSVPLASDLTQSILAAAPIILYVYDVQNERSVFQNRRFGELLGHAPGDVTISEWKQFIHSDDALAFVEHRNRLKQIKHGETLQWEFRMKSVNGDWRWFACRDVLMTSDGDGRPLLIVGSASDVTEQKRAEQLKDLLAGEMRHRAKNLVAVVDAIARQSRPKNQPAAEAFIDTFMGRLLTLLNTGDIILASAARTADLGAVLQMSLQPFMHDETPHRITIDGPLVTLLENTAGGLALASHELATNAVKYGALSIANGRVAISWSLTQLAGKNLLVMDWVESGGPTVVAPTGVGFGTRVIKQSIAHEPHPHVTLEYRPQGLRCRFEFESTPI